MHGLRENESQRCTTQLQNDTHATPTIKYKTTPMVKVNAFFFKTANWDPAYQRVQVLLEEREWPRAIRLQAKNQEKNRSTPQPRYHDHIATFLHGEESSVAQSKGRQHWNAASQQFMHTTPQRVSPLQQLLWYKMAVQK
jgi:hypothetical protein